MHPLAIPPEIIARVEARCGRAHPFEELVPARTAFVVIDLQVGFMDAAISHAFCPMAERIVPAVNRLADAVRATGGGVFWVQNTHDPRCDEEWSVMQRMATPAARARRVAAMTEGTPGHALWPALDVRPGDERVKKHRFSAFIQGSSDLPERLRARGFDTVLIGGTVTNVCCESSARDAMMTNFRTIMVADCNAANSDAEHNASLASFWNIFGDVMTTDHVIDRLRIGAAGKAAA
ncbi:cysteine hydrolase [Roseomonas sp. CECT 9278]|uniref:cysteine hydrolase n=1 Tax=Roseomonas sp. CECT 9278 TaxID=2845823 RepID=UPI001E52F820|nr:cysteine hydrolase [Roseomonas sp. CECT 9278]CAH0303733.1 Isochorismatase family protein YecD [Roseomonas sp. CECT 9278]